MEPAGATPRIFISYSHDDETWKDRVVSQLGVLEHEGLLSVWEDRQIAAGGDWLPEIETALQSCNVALLLISDKFLTPKFILGNEVPVLLQRREQEGVRVIPVILKPCALDEVGWLKTIQSRSKDGKPLSSMSESDADAALAILAKEIAKLARRATSVDDARADGGNTQAAPAVDRKDDSGPKPSRFTWLFSCWSSQTLLQRQLLIGLLLGVLLGLGLHYLHAQLTLLRAVDDLAMDFLLRLQWSAPISQPALSFVLLDIDEQTYQAWKTPSPVPRDRLLKLIQYAVEGGAALVVVDIDLSQTGNDRNADRQLQDYSPAHNY